MYVEQKVTYTLLSYLKLLLAYVSKQRHEGFEVDRGMAANDAKALYKAGEKKLGTDEKTFIEIFSERSRAHLAAVSSAYHDMYGHALEKVHLFLCHFIFSYSYIWFCCFNVELILILPGSKEGNIRPF